MRFNRHSARRDFPSGGGGGEHHLRLEDGVHRERLGAGAKWSVVPASGVSVYNSSAFGNSTTDELKAYPEDMLSAPLDERAVELSFHARHCACRSDGARTRDGRTAIKRRA
ncbi:MAG: hypothetical protein WKF84_26050 [Pyrinomonadaceae bacterium]